MENEASRRRECVVALRIREKREDVEEERKEEREAGRVEIGTDREKGMEERENWQERHTRSSGETKRREKSGRTGGTARQVYPGAASFSALV